MSFSKRITAYIRNRSPYFRMKSKIRQEGNQRKVGGENVCDFCDKIKPVEHFPCLIRKYRDNMICLTCLKKQDKKWISNYVSKAHQSLIGGEDENA